MRDERISLNEKKFILLLSGIYIYIPILYVHTYVCICYFLFVGFVIVGVVCVVWHTALYIDF